MPLGLAKSILADNKRNAPITIDYLLVGGGGAGGSGTYGGGGGGGSVMTSYGTSATKITLKRDETYYVRIGRGGIYTDPETLPYGRCGWPTLLYGPNITIIAAVGGGFGGKSTAKDGSLYSLIVRDLGKFYTITNITKINSTTAEITTSAAHGVTMANNQYISISGVNGMVQINNRTYQDDSTGWAGYTGLGFEISSVPSSTLIQITTPTNTAWNSYTSGGTLYYMTYYQGGSPGGGYGQTGALGGVAWPNWATYGFSSIIAPTPYYPGSAGPFMCGTSYNGGNGATNVGGGGGGAGGDADTATPGIGYSNSISGSSVTYAPGSSWNRGANSSYGIGGAANNNGNYGICILRIPTILYSGNKTGSPTVSTAGSDTILTYTSDGTYTA